MEKSELLFIIKLYFFWLLGLFVILFLAVKFLPLQNNFLGGGLENYLKNPYLLSFGNFDGEHYISIAKRGYGLAEYAFFPLYPILIKFLGGSIASGIIISLTSFLAGLIGFYKLLRLDFSEKFSKNVLILLIVFPASFYFAAVYTEGLFFALTVWVFYFARLGKFLPATVLGILLSATRFVGIIVLPAIIIEWFYLNIRKKDLLRNFPKVILMIPLGTLSYMYYLQSKTHDMFAFYHNLANFGEQRSSHLITFPQVFYRYIFKILPNISTTFFPVIFTTYLEFMIGILYLVLSLLSFFRLRLSYAFFLLFGYLIPTFSGSFSSLPRYVLVLFPAYILIAILLEKERFYLFAFAVVSTILLIISFALFSRGFWLA